jgi:hypothetical protein
MKRTIIIGLMIGAFLSSTFSQQKDDLTKVKDALVNYVLYSQEIDKQNIRLSNDLKRILEDIKNIKTIAQLDSLKGVYGILEEKDEKNGKDKGNKK